MYLYSQVEGCVQAWILFWFPCLFRLESVGRSQRGNCAQFDSLFKLWTKNSFGEEWVYFILYLKPITERS